MNRKLLITLLILFLIAGGLVGLYLTRSQQGTIGASFWGNFFGGSQNPGGGPITPTPNFPPDDTNVGSSTPQNITQTTSLFERPGISLVAGGFISGATFVGNKEIHYATRDTGNLYSLHIASGTIERYSNITVPGSYAAQIANSGKVALVSSNIQGTVSHTLLTTVGTSTSDAILKNTFTNPQLSPDGALILYIENVPNGGARVRIHPISSKVADTTIYTSALQDIAAEWVSASRILIHTKASYRKDATAFLANLSGTELNEITSPLRGLTALTSPSGARALIGSISSDGEIILSVFARGESTILPVRTLPEKCVWSRLSEDILYCAVPQAISSNKLPDAWWMGDVSFNDEIWKFNIKEGGATRLQESTGMDIISPLLSPKDELLIFRNKKNASLWSLNLIK